MTVLARPFATAGVALVAAGTISATALQAPAPVIPHISVPGISLQASVVDILTLPVWRQSITNQLEFLGVELTGLGGSATGVVQSIASIPPTVATVVQQLAAADIVGALQTVNDAVVSAGQAIFVPSISATITVAQQQLAIQGALQLALPLAYVDLAGGLSSAFTSVSAAVILATQSLLAAVTTLNPSAIITALGEGFQSVGQSVVAGGGDLVNGVASAQDRLVTALQTRVPPVVTATPAAALPKAASVAPLASAPSSAVSRAVAPVTSTAKSAAAAGSEAVATVTQAARSAVRAAASVAQRDSGPSDAGAPRAAASRHAAR